MQILLIMKVSLGPVPETEYYAPIHLLSQSAQAPGPARAVQRGLTFLRQWKALDERPYVSIKYHREAGGFYFSLLIVLLTVHTVSLTFLTTLLAPNKKGWAGGGGKRGGVGEP